MPLIINELITSVETPAEHEEKSPQSSGSDDADKELFELIQINSEREERLSID